MRPFLAVSLMLVNLTVIDWYAVILTTGPMSTIRFRRRRPCTPSDLSNQHLCLEYVPIAEICTVPNRYHPSFTHCVLVCNGSQNL